LYYFRQRLSQYNVKTGENLLEKAFEQITDAQIVDLKVRTGMQRMDSTQIASNIVSASRMQLLVEALQRVERILSEADQTRLAETFAPYTKDSAGHYTYRVKGQEAMQAHLQEIGKTIHALLLDLKSAYAAESAYQVLERIFADNFHLLESGPKAKENKELTSDCLQSVDDLEATYRTKGTGHYKGYVANLTETCDPENELQLITKVQVAPNNIDDSQLLAEALPNLKQRTKLETIYTDGGHGGPAADAVLQEQQVEHIQTAIRGLTPNPEKLHLADFTIKFNEDSQPVKVTCPQGQTETVHSTSQKKAFVANFTTEVCQTCPLVDKCLARPSSRDPRHHLRFTQADARASERRRHCQEQRKDGRNLRAAVEASMRSLKYPFPAGKLPVRGKFRVASLLIGSAAVSNVRRIQRYQQAKTKAEMAQPVAHDADKCTQK
ncbi:MAG: transposase, partial [Chloroflexi bacterium]|nr:transposase [Chloroflexota bacterium]